MKNQKVPKCNVQLAETAVSKANAKRTNGHQALSGITEVHNFVEVEVYTYMHMQVICTLYNRMILQTLKPSY